MKFRSLSQYLPFQPYCHNLMAGRGGDDLQDDYVPDELVATSGDEEEYSHRGSSHGDLSLDDAPKPSGSVTHAGREGGSKRKRTGKDKQRRLKKPKLKETQDEESPSIARQSLSELAEYLSGSQAKSFSRLSRIELEDLRIPESAIVDASPWAAERTLESLPDFIAKVTPSLRLRLSQKPKANGAPTLIFVAGSALRVADVTRVLKNRKLRGEKGGDVGKFFARHIKLEDHITYLRRTKIGAAVGTPGRLGKLLELESMAVSALTHIIIDVSYRDAKKRSVFDIPETRDEVFGKILSHKSTLQGIKTGKVQILLF